MIDTGGVVRFRGGSIQFAHRNKHVADSPANDHILDVVSGLIAGREDHPEEPPTSTRAFGACSSLRSVSVDGLHR